MAEKRRGSVLENTDEKRIRTCENSTSTTPSGKASATTFRISEIPIDVSKQQLLSLVGGIASPGSGGSVIVGSTIAPSPTDGKRYQVATITFECVPLELIPCIKSGIVRALDIVVGGVSSKVSFDSHFIGLTPLNDGPGDYNVDLIFVTGLAGHAFGSWKASGEHTMWIRDFLGKDLDLDHEVSGKSRMLTYGYDSKLLASNSKAGIHEFSRTFLEAVENARRLPDENRRPIIFVAHSLGGIVVKKALVEAAKGSDKDLQIFRATYACFFLGVPNRGMKIDQLKAMVKGQPNESLVSDLGVGSQFLDLLHNTFCERFSFKDSRIISIYETKLSQTVKKSESGQWQRTGPEIEMVSKESAIYSIRTEALYDQLSRDVDHSTLAKFASRADQDYIIIRGRIIECVGKASGVIEKRFSDIARNTEASGNDNIYKLPFELDYARNPKFTGREQLLEKLDMNIRARGSHKIVLHGTGGMGKTEIVLEYIHAHHTKYTSVFWVNAASEETTMLDFRSIAQRLVDHHASLVTTAKPDYPRIAQNLSMAGMVDQDGQLSNQEETTKRIIAAVKRWYNQKENRNWLLILDNVDDLESFNIGSFMPTSSHGTILITSRRRECCRFGTGLEIEEMLQPDGVLLLLKSAGLQASELGDEGKLSSQGSVGQIHANRPHTDERAAKEIAKKLGYLPLAIDQSGAYIAARHMPLQKYMKVYEENFRRVFKERPERAVWSYRDQTVFTTWETSFRVIESENKEAAELLLLCSFLSNEDIWDEMLCRGYGLEEDGRLELCLCYFKQLMSLSVDLTLDDRLKPLFSYSLAKRKRHTDSFNIHPMVHLWARERLSPQEKSQKAENATLFVHRAISHADSRPSGQWRYEMRIMAHIESVRDSIKKYLNLETQGSTETSLILGMNSLASTYVNQGRWKEAEELFLQAVEVGKRVLGNEHRKTLTLIDNLASTYLKQGRWKEAEEHLLQVVETSKRVLGNEHPDTLLAMNNLASAYMKQGLWKEAEELILQVVEAGGRVQGIEHSKTLIAMGNLAMAYKGQGRWKEAEKLGLQVVEARKKVMGNEHPDTLTAMNNLALTYLKQRRLKEAEELNLQVVEVMKKVLGNEHPDTLVSTKNLASTYLYQKRWGEAEELLLQVMEVGRRVLEGEHPNTLEFMGELALAYIGQERWKDAEELSLQVVEARKRVLRNEHPDLLTAMDSLALVYMGLRQWEETEKLLLQLVEVRRRVLGNEHPKTLKNKRDLALTRMVLAMRMSAMEQRVHPDSHDQPGPDLHEPGTVEGGGGVGFASSGGGGEGTGERTSGHTDSHEQPSSDLQEPETVEGAGGAASTEASPGEETNSS